MGAKRDRDVIEDWLRLGSPRASPMVFAREHHIEPTALLRLFGRYELATPLSISDFDDLKALFGELQLCGALRLDVETERARLSTAGEIAAFAAADPDGGAIAVRLENGPRGGADLVVDSAHLHAAAFLGPDARAAGADGAVWLVGPRVSVAIRPTEQSRRAPFRRIPDLFEAGRWRARPEPIDDAAGWSDQDWLRPKERRVIDQMLRRPGASRAEAYAKLDAELAERLDGAALARTIGGAAQTGTDLSLRLDDPALSVTVYGRFAGEPDPATGAAPPLAGAPARFLLEPGAAEACWVVRAPTPMGVLTWIDVLDRTEESLCKAFGRRPDGQTLCTQGPGCWRALIDDFARRRPRRVGA